MSKKKNKGFTLIELVIAIVIMVIIASAVAGLVITVAKNYRVSTTSTLLSSEAANTKNQLNQMIMDATDTVVYFDAEKKLEIPCAEGIRDICYNEESMELTLYENDVDEGILASYVSKFEVDTSDFKENRTVSFYIEYTYDNASYDTDFQVTNRNEAVSTSTEVVETAHFKVTPKEIYLEPNEDYELSCKLLGGSGDNKGKYTYSLLESTDSVYTAITLSSTYDKVLIHVGRNETGNDDGVMYLQLNSVDKDENGNPEANALITIRIRRVTAITGSINLDSGTSCEKGAVYTVTVKVSGTNLEKAVGMSFDDNYIDPKQVDWEYDYKDGYIEVTSKSDTKYTFTLLKDLETGSTLTINMTALHPTGASYNKSGIKYDSIECSLEIIKDQDEIKFIPTDGLLRNQDKLFDVFKQDMPTDIGYTIDEYNKIIGQCTKRWFYRFREVTLSGYGSWVPFRATLEGGGQQKLSAQESMRLEPDKYYEIQFVYAVIDKNSKKVYYPICSELLNQSGFEGYSAGWKSSQSEVDLTSCTWNYYMAPVEIKYAYYYNYTIWWPEYSSSTENESDLAYVGSESYPKIINKNASATITLTSKYMTNQWGLVDIKLYYKNGSTWQDVTSNHYIQHDSGIFRLNNLNNWATGDYKLQTYIKGWPIFGNGDNLFSTFDYNSYKTGTKDYTLFDESSGEGMIYFTLTE